MRSVCAVVAGALIAGCGGEVQTLGVEVVRELDVDLGASVAGLSVSREDVSEVLQGARPAYAEALGLYSFRADDLLEATLQVTRFSADIEVNDEFRTAIINRLGGSTPSVFRAGEQLIYETTTSSQLLSVWFKDHDMYVLAMRGDFPRPASLLRATLEVSA